MRIAIIAALPSELKPLVGTWRMSRDDVRRAEIWQRVDEAGDEFVAVCAGMGADCARRAFAAAEALGTVDVVISAGLAGATDPAARVGECLLLSEIIDVQTGERFSLTEGDRKLRIATAEIVAGVEEKARLWASYGVVMVDMEAATVARLATMRGIPMCCVKAVSDDSDARLPDLNRFIVDGHLKMATFLMYVAVRPHFWGSLIKLGKGSALASKALAKTLKQLLADKNWERANLTGSVGGQG